MELHLIFHFHLSYTFRCHHSPAYKVEVTAAETSSWHITQSSMPAFMFTVQTAKLYSFLPGYSGNMLPWTCNSTVSHLGYIGAG